MSDRIPVILDCDPGHDDMVALVLALGSDRLDVKAITNVAGNKAMEKVNRNTLNILNWCGVEKEVAAGAVRPLVRPYNRTDTDGCHGLTGLDGFDFPADNPLKLSKRRAIEVMADVVRHSPEPVTLITTGPTTNVGLFLGLSGPHSQHRPDLHDGRHLPLHFDRALYGVQRLSGRRGHPHHL